MQLKFMTQRCMSESAFPVCAVHVAKKVPGFARLDPMCLRTTWSGRKCMWTSRGCLVQGASARSQFVALAYNARQYLNCCRQLQRGADTVPEEIQTMWAKAVSGNCRAAKTALFQKWLKAAGDYGRLPGCMQCTWVVVCTWSNMSANKPN